MLSVEHNLDSLLQMFNGIVPIFFIGVSSKVKWPFVAVHADVLTLCLQVVRMVMRYHEELRQKEERAKREEQAKIRRVASSIAKEVRAFWTNVEKVTSPQSD